MIIVVPYLGSDLRSPPSVCCRPAQPRPSTAQNLSSAPGGGQCVIVPPTLIMTRKNIPHLYCRHTGTSASVCDHVEQDSANKSRILPRARTAIARFYDILSISRYLLDNIKWPN